MDGERILALNAVSSSEAPRVLAEWLERGEVIYFPICPFPLPQGADYDFLLKQRLGRGHKNISFDPHRRRVKGYDHLNAAEVEDLRRILASFSRVGASWLAELVPQYARAWSLDQVTFRPEEEAKRKLRRTARNDLLHVDAFPGRPTQGRRILRLFVNVNPTEPRVWATTDPFGTLLARYGAEAGWPAPVAGQGWPQRLGQQILGLIQPVRRQLSAYDEFMLRFHDYLKRNREFQAGCRKRLWHFRPGSAWLAMTDTASHAALRGCYALEHSFFVAPETLSLPEESPPALLERACGLPVLRAA